MNSSEPLFYLAVDIGIKNLGYCLYNGNEIHFGVFSIEPIAKKKYCKEFGITVARIKVAGEWFESVLEKYQVERVVVEKQVARNTKARILEATILSLAVSRGIEIEGYHAKNKFQYEKDLVYDAKKKEHKKIAEKYARRIITNFGYSTEYFDSYKKKDDISDSICMCVFSKIENEKEESKKFINWLIK